MMTHDKLMAQCKTLDERELVSILTRDRAQYEDDFREAAAEMLDQRGHSLDSLINKVTVWRYNIAEATVTIGEAVASLNEPSGLDQAWYFTHYLGDTVMVQRQEAYWAFHYYPADHDQVQKVFFLENQHDAENILTDFLRLDDLNLDEDIFFYEWQVLGQTASFTHIEQIAARLDKLDVCYLVEQVSHDAVEVQTRDQMPYHGPQVVTGRIYDMNRLPRLQAFHLDRPDALFVVLVPTKFDLHTESVLNELEGVADSLYARLEELPAGEELETQLALHEELEVLRPDDAELMYNKGGILYDLKRYADAADTWLSTLSLDIDHSALSNLDRTGTSLKEVLPQLDNVSKQIAVRHGLAATDALRDEIPDAFEQFQAILALQPDDAIAHLNLGYLYYEHTEESHHTRTHLEHYLTIEPEADDADAIRELLDNLDAS